MEANVLIFGGKGPALLGRDVLCKLDVNWKNLGLVHSVQLEPKNLLKKYEDVFGAEIGEIKGVSIKLSTTENFEPKFFKPANSVCTFR